ncbi:MAG TPA: hypothetical protein VIH03_02900 [Nitrososphaerales archaeon]
MTIEEPEIIVFYSIDQFFFLTNIISLSPIIHKSHFSSEMYHESIV